MMSRINQRRYEALQALRRFFESDVPLASPDARTETSSPSSAAPERSVRVLYVAGPGDVIGTYRHWQRGEDDPSQPALTYSAQFYDACCELDACGYLLSAHPRRERLHDDRFTLEHAPVPFCHSRISLLYHSGQLWYGLRILLTALRFRADVVFAVEGSTHLFLLSVLPRLGIQVVPLLQCVLSQKYRPVSRVQRQLWRWCRTLFARDCLASVVVSDEIAGQIREIAGEPRPILRIVPVYRREQFAEVPPPAEGPFTVLFVGRVEADKGVFALLDVAAELAARDRRDIRVQICGTRSALPAVKRTIRQRGLQATVTCLGYCHRPQLRAAYAEAQVAIVPTHSGFVEGFNKVVVEGVLAGRPVIASRACTDLELFGEAVWPVDPDDTPGYLEAVLHLCDNRAAYERARQCCLERRELFFERQQTWGAALRVLLTAVRDGRATGFGTDGETVARGAADCDVPTIA